MNLASNFFGQAAKLMDSHIQRQNLIQAHLEPVTLVSKPKIKEKKSKNDTEKKEDKEKKTAKMTGYRVFINERIKELKELPNYASNIHSGSGVKELNPVINAEWKNLPADKVEMYKRIAEKMQEQLDRKAKAALAEEPKKQPKPEISSVKSKPKEKAPEVKLHSEILSQKLNELLSKSEKKHKKPVIKRELSDTSSTPSLSEDERPHKKLKRS